MQLKKYQQKAIENLSEYLKRVEETDPKTAFIYAAEMPYNSDFYGDVPFVCVKIPTGGGKTLVACHAVAKIMQTILKNKMDRGIVMWFVPSEAIKSQTLRKLKDRTDWHRKALDEAFENKVRIFSNEEALRIRKEDVSDNICVVISSLDAFRKEKQKRGKYKVYQENGSLLSHFENMKDDKALEKDEQKTVINSLANVVRMSNPLVVLDEGQRVQSFISIEFIKDLNPSFIIEYTATPRSGSNILVDIHSGELKEEEMVKIPIVLESSLHWEQSTEAGIKKRKELEKIVKKSGEYIRPIALFQAEQEKESEKKITVGKIKEFLMKAGIHEDEIAIKTASRNDIENVNLFSKKCKIKYIITVNALAEGWDCSFAYILVSVANIGSKIAVEQIIGRIMRMPNAKRKKDEDLNRCYVFASARNFNEAANQIISGLEKNGYSRGDVINANQKNQKDEFVIERRVRKDFSVPIMSLEGDKLSFEDLVGENFELAKQNHEFEFTTHYDSDGRAIIDIKDDKWVRGIQQNLNLNYGDKNFTKVELVNWLDRKLHFTILEQKDKRAFLEKAVDYQLKSFSVTDLSVNRYVFMARLDEVIHNLLEEYAKKRFDKFIANKKIILKNFDKFPEKIIINQEIPEEFGKNYYQKIDKLNKEELSFIERIDLDSLPNVEFWIRNREKKDPFYIQGWRKGKFYPDFVVLTKKGNIVACEWKGEDRISNDDTKYKEEIGKIWESLGKGKTHFFLANNKNVEEVLSGIKKL
ncbi:MAG: DEAD/DEAH box helicase family protein [Candidatus Moranbacteria bacterium]|nr:DEAD/DEAH box helicase family protein [Candidatus Moranbacteria bacterium]